jgi:hypothetical protein
MVSQRLKRSTDNIGVKTAEPIDDALQATTRVTAAEISALAHRVGVEAVAVALEQFQTIDA